MKSEWVLRELKAVKEKYKGKRVDTFALNIYQMASDCIDTIENLEKRLAAEISMKEAFQKEMNALSEQLGIGLAPKPIFDFNGQDATKIHMPFPNSKRTLDMYADNKLQVSVDLSEVSLDPFTFDGMLDLSASEALTADSIAESQHRHDMENLQKLKKDIGMED
jgi:hypothetical protein